MKKRNTPCEFMFVDDFCICLLINAKNIVIASLYLLMTFAYVYLFIVNVFFEISNSCTYISKVINKHNNVLTIRIIILYVLLYYIYYFRSIKSLEIRLIHQNKKKITCL